MEPFAKIVNWGNPSIIFLRKLHLIYSTVLTYSEITTLSSVKSNYDQDLALKVAYILKVIEKQSYLMVA